MFAKQKYLKKTDFIDQFVTAKSELPGDQLEWLAEAREDAISRFSEKGIPTPAVEAWKFSNLTPLAETTFDKLHLHRSVHTNLDNELEYFASLPDGHRLVFVNGLFDPKLSDNLKELPKGVVIQSLSETLQEEKGLHLERFIGKIGEPVESPVFDLNTAMMLDGLVFYLPKNVILEKPVVVAHITKKSDVTLQTHTRNLFVAEQGAQGTIIECYMAQPEARYLKNVGTEVLVQNNASLVHVKIMDEADEGLHLASTVAEMGRDSYFESYTLNTGAQIARQETQVFIKEPNSRCQINSSLLLRDTRHGDNTSCVVHDASHCTSMQMCKSILADKSKGVFQGKTIVRREAQKTDGYQLNQNLLLSPTAQIDTKPELEIYADDVKCSHGATTGELDEEALLYLRSRGIDKETAKQMLVEAFLAEEIEAISFKPIHAHLTQLVSDWMQQHRKTLNRVR